MIINALHVQPLLDYNDQVDFFSKPLIIETIDDFTDESGSGFIFHDYTVDSLLGKLNEAIECYHDGESWEQIVSAGMNRDFTWKNSAEEYDQLYRQLLEK